MSNFQQIDVSAYGAHKVRCMFDILKNCGQKLNIRMVNSSKQAEEIRIVVSDTSIEFRVPMRTLDADMTRYKIISEFANHQVVAYLPNTGGSLKTSCPTKCKAFVRERILDFLEMQDDFMGGTLAAMPQQFRHLVAYMRPVCYYVDGNAPVFEETNLGEEWSQEEIEMVKSVMDAAAEMLSDQPTLKFKTVVTLANAFLIAIPPDRFEVLQTEAGESQKRRMLAEQVRFAKLMCKMNIRRRQTAESILPEMTNNNSEGAENASDATVESHFVGEQDVEWEFAMENEFPNTGGSSSSSSRAPVPKSRVGPIRNNEKLDFVPKREQS